MVATIGLLATPAAAESKLRAASDLDGLYFTIGPVASALRIVGVWDGGFGGEVSVVRVREHAPLSALGIAAGAVNFADRAGGHLWADLLAGTTKPLGIGIGLDVGLIVEVNELQRARFGGHGTLWVYSGVMPFLRVGHVASTGTFAELGLKIPLPAIRL